MLYERPLTGTLIHFPGIPGYLYYMNIKQDNFDAIYNGVRYIHFLEDGSAHWAEIENYFYRTTGKRVTYTGHSSYNIVQGSKSTPVIEFRFDNVEPDWLNLKRHYGGYKGL